MTILWRDAILDESLLYDINSEPDPSENPELTILLRKKIRAAIRQRLQHRLYLH